MVHTGKKLISLQFVWGFLLDCLFPKKCFVCQNEGEYLCFACFDKIGLAKQQCYLCNKEGSVKGICKNCQQESFIDEIVVACPYNKNPAGKMVEVLKYRYVEDLAKPLALLLAQKIKFIEKTKSFQKSIFFPIPLNKKRLAQRGFNQAEQIAKELSIIFSGSVDNKLLVRKKHTKQQAKLTREERLVNINNAFEVKDKIDLEKVVLVDDVVTTGATIVAVAKELKKVGAKKIIVLAVCHG